MDNYAIFIQLRNALVELYSREADARVIVYDAGLAEGNITFSGRAQTNWHNILAEAVRANRLDALLDEVLKTYGNNQMFLAAYGLYQHFIDQGGSFEAPDRLTSTVDGDNLLPGDTNGKNENLPVQHTDTQAGDKIIGKLGDNVTDVAIGKDIQQAHTGNIGGSLIQAQADVTTGGGAFVSGNVVTEADFVGRDKIVLIFPSLINDADGIITAMVKSIRDNKLINKRVFFEQHIEPAYVKLEQVHKDYERTLCELSYYFVKGEMNLEETLEWLTKRSLILRTERGYLKNFSVELETAKKRIVSDASTIGTTQSDIPDFVDSIDFFCLMVTEYFHFDDYHRSIYRHMIQELQDCRPEEIETVQNVTNLLNNTVFTYLPRLWESVTKSYLGLRGLCLS